MPTTSGPQVTASSSSSAAALLPGTTMTMVAQPVAKSGGSNVIVSLVTYLKDSVVRTVTSCGQLYSNHGRCNEIRGKLKAHREAVRREWEASGLYDHETPKQIQKRLQLQQGGISYDEFVFFERGKVDRGKVINLGFLMWGAPRFLPYALMFNPEMLPSPFQADNKFIASGGVDGSNDMWSNASRERTQAILSTLMIMEQQAAAVTGNFLENLNIFGKQKQAAKRSQLQTLVAETSDFFRTRPLTVAPSTPTAQDLLRRLSPLLYQVDKDFTRSERRLCHVPPCIVQGLARAVAGQGLPGVVAQLTPAFLQRGKLVGHLQKVAAADQFLVQAGIDLETIPKRLLQEACQERLIAVGPHRSATELRASLSEWLQLSTIQPGLYLTEKATSSDATFPGAQTGQRLEASTATSTISAETADEPVDSASPPLVYFNDNLARMALMACNGCAAVRDEHSASRLPLTLCAGGDDPANSNAQTLNDKSAPPHAKKNPPMAASNDKKLRIPLFRK
jgi:LETM1-like protein